MAILQIHISSLESVGPTPPPPPPLPSYIGIFFAPILSSRWTDNHPQRNEPNLAKGHIVT